MTSGSTRVLRTLYRGEIVWNRTQKRDRWGVKRSQDRAAGGLVHVEPPELRIVPEELWRAAHPRLERTRAVYAHGRPPLERPVEKYLLSGLAKCAKCGGSLVAFTNRSKAHPRTAVYGCMYHHKRGAKVCANPLLIRQERLDQVVLDAIAEALDERLLERAVDKAVDRLTRTRLRAPERWTLLERELADVEARIQGGLDALLAGTVASDELQVRPIASANVNAS